MDKHPLRAVTRSIGGGRRNNFAFFPFLRTTALVLLSFLLGVIFVSRAAAQGKKEDFGMTGIKICGNGDQRTIFEVLPDTPASHAGVKAGDYLLAIDSVDTKDIQGKGQNATLCGLIRGQPGTQVTLTLRRKNGGKVERITLTRISYDAYRAAHSSTDTPQSPDTPR